MARSHRKICSFVVAIIVLYIGVVATAENCPSNVASFSICSGLGSTGRNIYLSGVPNGTWKDCHCSLTLANTQKNNIIHVVNTTTITGCDYYLNVSLKSNNLQYSCMVNELGHIDMKDFPVYIYLALGTINDRGFRFCLNFSGSHDITLRCESQSTPTTALTYNNPTITTYDSSTNSNGNIPTNAIPTFTSTIVPSQNKPRANNLNSDTMIGIIIGSILAVLVVITSVIIIVCFFKRRKKKSPYETPLEPQDRPHSYVNAAVTPDNVNQNTQNGNPGMICLQNDLYKSVNDDKPVGRKGGNHEGMIYLENDLYISSNETDDVNQDADNSVPHQPVEYAVVNKTAKKSSSGHTVGPRGDEYTLVLRK